MIKLQDLPNVWKDRQNITTVTKPEDTLTKEQIDGSAFTANPDLKFRKSRIITTAELAKYKRPTKIREMLNYCKFRLGEIATCDKPSSIVLNTLCWYKSGRTDLISPGYLEAIKDYKELVDSAMAIDLRKKRKEISKMTEPKTVNKSKGRTLQTIEIDGITITTKARKDQTIKCAKEFIDWLNLQNTNMPSTIKEPKQYLTQIKAYMTNSMSLLPVIKQILDQRPWILETYQFEKLGKQQVLVLRDKSNTILPVKSIDIPVVETIENPDTVTNNSQQSIIEQFVSQLKNLGVKEFSIKL